MKRIMGLVVLSVAFMLPAVGFAAEGQTGVYIAPKFIYGLTQGEGGKGYIFDGSGDGYTLNIGSNTDDTFGGSIAFGYDFAKKFDVPVRAEIEYALFSEAEGGKTWRVGDSWLNMKQKFQIQTLFLNAYWDIPTGTKFTPYIGAGLGMGFIGTKGTVTADDGINVGSLGTGSKTVTNFAWNLGAGLGYDINDSWTIDVGYRFVGLGSVKASRYDVGGAGGYAETDNLYQHQFGLGVRFTF